MKLSKETEFFIYLLEHYAAERERTAGSVLAQWNGLGLTDFFYDMYERYHSEALENAYADIDAHVANAEKSLA